MHLLAGATARAKAMPLLWENSRHKHFNLSASSAVHLVYIATYVVLKSITIYEVCLMRLDTGCIKAHGSSARVSLAFLNLRRLSSKNFGKSIV